MSLRESQIALSKWVRAPEGVAKALEESDESGGALNLARLESLVRGDAHLGATARLEIYANAYFYRILGVLAEDYEALAGLLGQADFNDLVTSYLAVEPSRNPSLRHAGRRLPEFIETHPAAMGVRGRTPWAADLAAFEWARGDVFDAPDARLLTRESLARRAPEDFADLMLRTGPWLRKCTTQYDVAMLWKTGVAGRELDFDPIPEATEYLVWRNAERVLHRPIESLDSAALSLTESGLTFSELCEWAALRVDESSAPTLAAGWLEQWLSDGLLIDLSAHSGI